jgi:hypothetical protein
MVPSVETLTIDWPSGANAAFQTASAWPESMAICSRECVL